MRSECLSYLHGSDNAYRIEIDITTSAALQLCWVPACLCRQARELHIPFPVDFYGLLVYFSVSQGLGLLTHPFSSKSDRAIGVG